MNLVKRLAANQTALLISIVAVAGLVGFGVSYLVGSSRSSSGKISQNINCSGACVDLLGDRASPDTLAVTVGNYVTFNSADGKSHQLVIGEGSDHHGSIAPGNFDSGEFKSGESFKLQFKDEGTYIFVDKFNPETSIIVIVYTEGKEYKVE